MDVNECYELWDWQAFASKDDAYVCIEQFHKGETGLTVRKAEDGLWYIYKSKD